LKSESAAARSSKRENEISRAAAITSSGNGRIVTPSSAAIVVSACAFNKS
jgi:hypothetical protein